MRIRAVLTLLGLATTLAFSSACAATSPRTNVSTSAPVADTAWSDPDGGALSPFLPDSIHWARNAAEHRAVYEQAFHLARAALPARVSTVPAGQSWAVVLDADETILDNSLYQKKRGVAGFSPESWDEWVQTKQATALPGAALFLEAVHRAGGAIAIVTDRTEATSQATVENLRSLSLPFDVLLCKPATGDTSKSARWRRIEDGTASPQGIKFTIVMWIGDNVRDFPGGDQSVSDESFFEDFGTRFVVLPNPMYGSWSGLPRR